MGAYFITRTIWRVSGEVQLDRSPKIAQNLPATKSFRTLAFADPRIILPSVGILREPFYRLRVLYAGCAAPVSANQVERGSGIQERVAGWLDPIHSGNGVENDLSLGCVLFRNHAV
jgi:hypothetical protein